MLSDPAYTQALAETQQLAHYNAMALERESATSVQFAFALNLSQVVQQLLAPQLAYPTLLPSYADLPDLALEREVANATTALNAKADRWGWSSDISQRHPDRRRSPTGNSPVSAELAGSHALQLLKPDSY